MSLFTGMTTQQIISVLIMFGFFGLSSILLFATLYLIKRDTKEIGGNIPTATAWYIWAGIWFFWTQVAFVWMAPAEYSLTNTSGTQLLPWSQLNPFNGTLRFGKLPWLLAFFILGIASLALGFFRSRSQVEALHAKYPSEPETLDPVALEAKLNESY